MACNTKSKRMDGQGEHKLHSPVQGVTEKSKPCNACKPQETSSLGFWPSEGGAEHCTACSSLEHSGFAIGSTHLRGKVTHTAVAGYSSSDCYSRHLCSQPQEIPNPLCHFQVTRSAMQCRQHLEDKKQAKFWPTWQGISLKSHNKTIKGH